MLSHCQNQNSYTFLIVFILFSIFSPCGAAWAESAPEGGPQTPPVDQIIFVIIDGLEEKALQKDQTPNIIKLGESGIKVQDVSPALPDRTGPAMATILTGLEPARHGYIDSDDILRGDTLFDKSAAKGYKNTFFDGSDGALEALGRDYRYRYDENSRGKDRLVMNGVIDELSKKRIYLSVVFLPQLKTVLGLYGSESKEFSEAVTDSDNQVGRLIHLLHQSGRYENSLLVVTGASGAPPLVMSGPGVKKGVVIPAAGLVDIAPTVVKIAGLREGPCSGLILWDALRPGGELNERYLLEQRVNELSKAYNETRREIYRTQEERIGVEKGQSRMAAEKNLVLKEIGRRDQQIDRLESKIKVMKYAGITLLITFVFGYLYEYRYLKKKFLLFN